MRTTLSCWAALPALAAFALAPLHAASTIDTGDRLAYGANLGWIDFHADTAHGAVMGEYVCAGFIYSPNVGWISLGSGLPANGIHYQNDSGTDFGVNHDGTGNLRGYAYGSNIGWVCFEDVGDPSIDLVTGRSSGFAWSANCGWISLASTTAHVRTGTIQPGVSAPNGLPIAWLWRHFQTTDIDPLADPDQDGMSHAEEYAADTDPNDGADSLRITHLGRRQGVHPGDPDQVELAWTSQPTRCYAVQSTTELGPGSFADSDIAAEPGRNSASFEVPSGHQFFRMRAFRPLAP
ncbi:MAG: hypothetical protein AB9869_37580 [Verrucomicrobiia bacterium]